MIKKLLCALALVITCTGANAAGGDFPLERAPNRINDIASLQNGAKLFVNYCLNCHSASAMRYNKLKDIGLTDQQIRESLLFTGEKVGDLMMGSVSVKDGKAWFGAAPPDLSLMARAKSINAGPTGSDYIYTYLRTFYRDTSKPTGWDNLAFPNAGMPHVLWERQGPREMTVVTTQKLPRKPVSLQVGNELSPHTTQRVMLSPRLNLWRTILASLRLSINSRRLIPSVPLPTTATWRI